MCECVATSDVLGIKTFSKVAERFSLICALVRRLVLVSHFGKRRVFSCTVTFLDDGATCDTSLVRKGTLHTTYMTFRKLQIRTKAVPE